MIVYGILKDTHVVFVATITKYFGSLSPEIETSNQSLLELYPTSFCRGRINDALFALPLEWSGENEDSENKKMFLFALSYLVHRSFVLKISTFETIIRYAPDVYGLR